MSVRVLLCLSKLFKDYRKEAFVYVDPKFQIVCDFEKHIQKLFNIQFRIFLTIKDGNILLPSQENVHVIHSGDVIIVNKLDEGVKNGIEVSSIESGNEVNHTIEIENESNDEINPTKRGKRIRKRKKKPATGNDSELIESIKPKTMEANVIDGQSNKSLSKQSKKVSLCQWWTADVNSVSPEKSNRHIRFSNDTVETDHVTTSNKSFAPSSQSEVLQARVIRPVVVFNDVERYSVLPDNFASNKVATANNTQDWKQRMSLLKQFANDSNFAEVAASIDFEAIIKTIDKCNEFVALTEELKTYDIVGFKMLKIGKNYEPQLSEWIIALVKDVVDVDITLHILAGKDETSCPEGKLSMEICDEEDETSDLLSLKLSDMLNVKVFVSD